MKQRPNISIKKTTNRKIEYLRNLALENIQPDIVIPTTVSTTSKTKSKPSTPIIQKRDINKTNQFRVDMIKFGSSDMAINPDLLIENSDSYILTIISYKLLYGVETPTSKDLDIYCNGLRLDASTYSVSVNENIVITIQKTEAVDDTFDVNNFEIVSKFDPLLIGIGDVDDDGKEDTLITENNEDILK